MLWPTKYNNDDCTTPREQCGTDCDLIIIRSLRIIIMMEPYEDND